MLSRGSMPPSTSLTLAVSVLKKGHPTPLTLGLGRGIKLSKCTAEPTTKLGGRTILPSGVTVACFNTGNTQLSDIGICAEVPVVLLISLKAGALGLQLTVANNVYLMDPWWQVGPNCWQTDLKVILTSL